MNGVKCVIIFLILCSLSCAGAAIAQDDDSTRQILKQGLIGAGTGAIAASASGGKAGEGALIGAGTSVIGSALLDAITAPPSSGRAQRRGYAPPPPDEYYYADEPEEYYYEEPPRESTSTKVLKQGLIGAGTGAIAAGASGGKAGQGALIGAGTAVVGNALLDTLTQPAPQRRGRAYRKIPVQAQQQRVQVQEDAAGTDGGRKRIIKKYDASGKLVSEEEIFY